MDEYQAALEYIVECENSEPKSFGYCNWCERENQALFPFKAAHFSGNYCVDCLFCATEANFAIQRDNS